MTLEPHHHEEAGWKKFLPLIAIFTFIAVFTLGMQVAHGWSLENAMLDFMAAFFLIFGMFKVLRLKAFAKAYASYDLLASRSRVYAYVYPFLEVALGLAYYVRFELRIVNWSALVLMAVSALGVLIALLRKQKIDCACLGTVFKLPMTKVTLVEDLLMLAMAIYMVYGLSQPTAYSVIYSMESASGTTVDMTLTIKDERGETVKDFETVHEKELHLIGVRTDLYEFLHVHPVMNGNGVWEVEIEFPTEGPYQFYADFTPVGGEPQVLTFTMSIGEFIRQKLGGYEATQEIDGYQVTYHFPEEVQTGEVEYSVTVEKDGQLVTRFEDYLGAKGHSVVIKETTLEYEHVHPTSAETPSFTAHFPDGGRYAIFTQIQLEGKILTVPYLVTIEEGELMDDHMGH